LPTEVALAKRMRQIERMTGWQRSQSVKSATMLLQPLKLRARRNRRSLEAEARELLSDAVSRGSVTSLRDLADQIAALTPKVPQTDSTDLVREDRLR
jgi:plasmid stability protein